MFSWCHGAFISPYLLRQILFITDCGWFYPRCPLNFDFAGRGHLLGRLFPGERRGDDGRFRDRPGGGSSLAGNRMEGRGPSVMSIVGMSTVFLLLPTGVGLVCLRDVGCLGYVVFLGSDQGSGVRTSAAGDGLLSGGAVAGGGVLGGVPVDEAVLVNAGDAVRGVVGQCLNCLCIARRKCAHWVCGATAVLVPAAGSPRSPADSGTLERAFGCPSGSRQRSTLAGSP